MIHFERGLYERKTFGECEGLEIAYYTSSSMGECEGLEIVYGWFEWLDI